MLNRRYGLLNAHFMFFISSTNIIQFSTLVQAGLRRKMTQKQLDLLQFNSEEWRNITLSENEVIFEFDDRFSLIVRRHRHSTQLLLKSGRRRLKLPSEIFDSICNTQISVRFLKQFLEYGM